MPCCERVSQWVDGGRVDKQGIIDFIRFVFYMEGDFCSERNTSSTDAR